jgi:hypothetical protein
MGPLSRAFFIALAILKFAGGALGGLIASRRSQPVAALQQV